MHHFGDPCRHCGTPHDEIQPGPCEGDPARATPIAYCSLGVRWDGVERYRVRFSDGRIEERCEHISAHAPYYHFGYSDALISPPHYDERLRS